MHLDDHERRALAKIEADLTDTDPAFSRLLHRNQHLLPRHLPGRLSLIVSALMLVLGLALLVIAVALPKLAGLLPAAALLLAAAPVPPAVDLVRRTHERSRLHRDLVPGKLANGLTTTAQSRARGGHNRPNVIVTTNGRPGCDGALRFAAREAELRAADLVVVIPYMRPVDPDLSDIERPDSELRGTAKRRAEEALRRAFECADSRAQVPDHTVLAVHGDLRRVLAPILDLTDLIIVGGRYPRLFGRMILALPLRPIVAHHMPVPLVVVPPSWPNRAP